MKQSPSPAFSSIYDRLRKQLCPKEVTGKVFHTVSGSVKKTIPEAQIRNSFAPQLFERISLKGVRNAG